MTELPELHREALAFTRAYVSGIADDQWSRLTPCEGWDVREVVNHLVAGNFWAAELGAGRTIDEVGDALDGDLLGDDPVAAFVRSAGAADAAFSASGAMDAPCHVSYGPVPGRVYAGHRFLDVLIHGWDLAMATGQHTDLPPSLVEACWDIIAPQVDGLTASGMFGDRIDVPDDADLQSKLLGLLGRSEAS